MNVNTKILAFLVGKANKTRIAQNVELADDHFVSPKKKPEKVLGYNNTKN